MTLKVVKTASLSAVVLPNGNLWQQDSNGNLGYFVGGTEQCYFDATGNIIFLGTTAPASAQNSIGTAAAALDLSVKTGAQFNFRVNGATLFAINTGGVPATSHGTSLVGEGFPAIVARLLAVSQTTTQTNAINFAPSAGIYRLTAGQLVTATTGTTAATIGYTDTAGQAQSYALAFNLGGSNTLTVAPAATGDYKSIPETISVTAATNITLTFTVSASATYWPYAILERLS